VGNASIVNSSGVLTVDICPGSGNNSYILSNTHFLSYFIHFLKTKYHTLY